MKSVPMKYFTKRFYHYSLVLGIVLVVYPLYDIYKSIEHTILLNEEYSSWIDLFFLSIEMPLFKFLIYSFIIIFVGITIMNYAKKGFNEKVYSNDSSDNLTQNIE